MTEPVIIAETADYYVINKPAGFACEPPSNAATIRDWLLAQHKVDPNIWDEDTRYGIVHRLDSDTSGVLIWAKTPSAQARLRLLWQGRAVEKTYVALVAGEVGESGAVELPILRDNKNDRQTVAFFPNPKARPAITDYRRLAVGSINHNPVSLVEAHPVTGRTHQIRVHMKAIGHPIVGDRLYGEKASEIIAQDLGINRQALHAAEITVDGSHYQSPLPPELKEAVAACGISYPADPEDNV
ncbi:MAG: RNA pseudouridine synthase [Patescibacteria group bacterium]